MPKKSGQTALILVIVTMITVLGIGVAATTQSNINLRNTVYSTQSEQALACAEAGAEAALGVITENDPSGNGFDLTILSNNPSTVRLGDCQFTYQIYSYPTAEAGQDPRTIIIPQLDENSVQEIAFETGKDVKTLDIEVQVPDSSQRGGLAVYLYSDDDTILDRKFYYFSNSGLPDDFTEVNVPGGQDKATIKLNDVDNNIRDEIAYIRLRALYRDLSLQITNFPADVPTGYFIVSTGEAGIVRRVVNVYRYFSQLPSGFDEAIVNFGEN